MTPRHLTFVERHDLGEYRFIGDGGDRATAAADRLLNLVALRCGAEVAARFAVPRFDSVQSSVTWLAAVPGPLAPLTSLDAAAQGRALDGLAAARAALSSLAQSLAGGGGQDARSYGALLPLMLTAPDPYEDQVYVAAGGPVVVCWGMQKAGGTARADALGAFLDGWRERLALLERAQERQRREAGFLARLTRAGARSGAVDVSLLWNDRNDLDLHVVCPDGSRICFENKAAAGGLLDIDRNARVAELTAEPVENISWSTKPSVPGRYAVGVHFFRQHDPGVARSLFTVRLKVNGQTRHFQGEVADGEYLEVGDFIVPA